jgi:hypothetical protein
MREEHDLNTHMDHHMMFAQLYEKRHGYKQCIVSDHLQKVPNIVSMGQEQPSIIITIECERIPLQLNRVHHLHAHLGHDSFRHAITCAFAVPGVMKCYSRLLLVEVSLFALWQAPLLTLLGL